MSVASVRCRTLLGLDAAPVDVEVHLGAGLPNFAIVGLPAAAVRESRERVRSALVNSGFEWPAGRITIGLSPADLPKEGARFDLAIALGILCASGQLQPEALAGCEVHGELGLDGELRPVTGTLLVARAFAAGAGASASVTPSSAARLVVPAANLAEAAWVADRLVGANSLLDVCAALTGAGPAVDAAPVRVATLVATPAAMPGTSPVAARLEDVRGQWRARRALLVAAAGGHSLLMIGPPGCGKSMLAQRLPGLLPALDATEAMEVACIASVSGQAVVPGAIARPFRAPHHSASANAIVGGGPRARPGEVTLAHRGVLFLDELPEFDRRVLEALREPLETGLVAITRVGERREYPARFQLVAAMNPCPCGYSGDATRRCRCSPKMIDRYRGRVSGPLLDRIDLRLEMSPVTDRELLELESTAGAAPPDEALTSTAAAAARVLRARDCALRRQGVLNADLAPADVDRFCVLDAAAAHLLAASVRRFGMSARSVHRIRRIARTLADLEPQPAERIDLRHLGEALQLRRDMGGEPEKPARAGRPAASPVTG